MIEKELIPEIQTVEKGEETPLPQDSFTRKGNLRCECKCGCKTNITDEIINDGLNWTMIVGSEHYMKLVCPECGAWLKMYIEEIVGDAVSEESNKD